MKKIAAILSFLFVATLCFGQEPVKREHVIHNVKAQLVSAQRGASKIVVDVPTTDVLADSAKTKAPAERGEACGGCYSTITFDNYTGYWVKCYLDGVFKGYVEPWGSGSVESPFFSRYYCETAGGTYSWEGIHDQAEDLWVNLRE